MEKKLRKTNTRNNLRTMKERYKRKNKDENKSVKDEEIEQKDIESDD